MSIFDNNKLKQENEYLKKRIYELEQLLNPTNQQYLNNLNKKEILEEQINDLNNQINYKVQELKNLNNEIKYKTEQLIIMDENLLIQDFGLYQPIYNFANSDLYKDRLNYIRDLQKQMVKNNTATLHNNNWSVNGSLSEGQKMVKDNIKQILKTFNEECEILIDKVKYNNIDSIKKRIFKSFNDLNKLNSRMGISITNDYLNLKLEELNLSYEYQLKKQEEKEELNRIKEEQKEQQRVLKELEEARKNTEKEQKHYQIALNKIIEQINTNTDNTINDYLLEKQNELTNKLNEINDNLKNIDYRTNNQKAGYVYIISNIGAFGENIYKIGMTRRLDPLERISELSGASVPFKFDVHAMIFSDDAPKLESILHKEFENKKVNLVNGRKEFFNVTLDEIKNVVHKNYNKVVEFKNYSEAKEYRESLLIKNGGDKNILTEQEKSNYYVNYVNTLNYINNVPNDTNGTKNKFPTKIGNKNKKQIFKIKLNNCSFDNGTMLDIIYDSNDNKKLKLIDCYGQKICNIDNIDIVNKIKYYLINDINFIVKYCDNILEIVSYE